MSRVFLCYARHTSDGKTKEDSGQKSEDLSVQSWFCTKKITHAGSIYSAPSSVFNSSVPQFPYLRDDAIMHI